eukprot:Pgem_evm1s10968
MRKSSSSTLLYWRILYILNSSAKSFKVIFFSTLESASIFCFSLSLSSVVLVWETSSFLFTCLACSSIGCSVFAL